MVLLLFNWFGYKLVLNYLQQEADLQLESRIDINDYDDAQLMEIRFPLNMPYQNSSTEFERHYGEIEIDGKYYSFVKRKIEGGYLILKCIPNSRKEIIKNTDNMLFQATNGIDQENNNNTSPLVKVIKCFLGDFDNDQFNFHLDALPVFNYKNFSTATSFINRGFATTPEQPPEYFFSI